MIIIIISIHDKDAECLSNIISELLDLDRSEDIIMAKNISKKKKKSFKSSLTRRLLEKMDYRDTE